MSLKELLKERERREKDEWGLYLDGVLLLSLCEWEEEREHTLCVLLLNQVVSDLYLVSVCPFFFFFSSIFCVLVRVL